MIVVDASAMVEALVGREPSAGLLDALAGELHAPHLLDIEVLSALRGLNLGKRVGATQVEDAMADFFALTITRHDTEPYAQRVWQLRHQFTAYDALYLSMAEGLNAPLYTCDSKLAAGPHRAEVRIASSESTGQ